MKDLRNKIREFGSKALDKIEYSLKRLCGQPTPFKRFIVVLVLGSILAIANIALVVSSIYNIGKQDAEKTFLELQHIKSLELQHSSDSVKNQLKIKN